MERRIFAYFRDIKKAEDGARDLQDAGHTARVDTTENPDIPFRFGGGRPFVIGLAIGLFFGLAFGVLIGADLIATPITWPVMSAGLPAIATLFAMIFGSIGGFTGWFVAGPWQIRYVVTSAVETEEVEDIKAIVSQQQPYMVREEVAFGRRAA